MSYKEESDLLVRSAQNAPYGSKAQNNDPDQKLGLMLEGDAWQAARDEATHLPDIVLSERQACDIELLINGGFSPLTGFLNEADYKGCVENMRLADGTLWPMPITLDVNEETSKKFKVGDRVGLRNGETDLLAILTVESIYKPDKALEAANVFGSPDDKCHPAIRYLFDEAGDFYIGGTVHGLQLPAHYDFTDIRLTPTELRQRFAENAFQRIVGFQTRNPMHRSHRELTLMAARDAKANVLIHPVVGMTKPGDVDHYTRVRVYKEIIKTYPKGMAYLSLLPLAMRMAGPRECLWHAIIRKNYGCTHFIVGRDHAGPGNNKDGKPFYDPYAAQELVNAHKEEVGIEVLSYQMVVYVEDMAEYSTVDQVPEGARVLSISGTELRRRLYKGLDIPEWFSYPQVVSILRKSYPPPAQQGFTVFFTGLSGSGKSTLGNALRVALLEDGRRTVTLLDGDWVRQHLSTELGFSKEHRDLNVRRIAYVASEITKAGGVAIICAIAPYKDPRRYAREIVSKHGGFFEVHVATSLEACEARDRKGLYKKARAGVIKGFTGIDDPYEAPENPELIVDSERCSVHQAVSQVVLTLEQSGFM
eukprot:TRINITY_DN2040_c0_g1_i1.p1 TRINITY_DN2040_c0_g1~~TRINITY_DN2040_c0_g1_i1.p1  ORF type:complete len:603 (+),score=247.31 TRINITY_DN2040_c0_g1_i1:40-1809(+)